MIKRNESRSIRKRAAAYPPELYHKMLDYRIAEILLTTLVFGVLIFRGLHR